MRFALMIIIFVMALSLSAYAGINDNNQQKEEINTSKIDESISGNTKDESFYEQSNNYSEQLAVKLDSYIEFLANNPPIEDVATKYNEINSLFSLLGNICKEMGDEQFYKMIGDHVKATEIENCNDRKHALAPFVANAIVKTAKYYADKGDKATAKRMYRDVIVRFTGLKYQSQVKEAEFGLEDLKQ